MKRPMVYTVVTDGGKNRELTREERTAIRKLAVNECANFDREYDCLPLDSECYMIGKWWTGAYCMYFQNAVLPLDTVLKATLTGREMPQQEICVICGNLFTADAQQIYCSHVCQKEGNRRRSRERMRKKRRKEQVGCYD